MRKIIQGESINMPNKTVGYLADTFSAGSKAVIHSSAFALKADSEDDPHIAHFFCAVAAPESVQA
jgi:rubrerythrin